MHLFNSFFKQALFGLFLCSAIFINAQEIKIHHLQDNVDRDGNVVGTPATFTLDPLSTLSDAFAIPINNRKTHAGRSDGEDAASLQGDDMSGATKLTGTSTLSYYRVNTSDNDADGMNFQTAIWEYTGTLGGHNEFIVRGRYEVQIGTADSSSDKDVDLTGAGIINPNKCIPFITGFINDATPNGNANATAIAYLSSPNNMVVDRGGEFSTSEVTVFVTLVEFTGDNWKVLHGKNNTDNPANTGNIVLYDGYDGTSYTGVPYSVFDWDNAILFSQSVSASNNDNGNKHNVRSQWPIFTPNTSDQTVDWIFADTRTSANNKNRHFVHVLDNPQVSITRYDDASFADGGNAANKITLSPNVSATNVALIIGTTISDGAKTHPAGYRNYFFNSNSEIEHWASNAGVNPVSRDANHIQVIDFGNLDDVPVQRDGPGGLITNLELWLKADKGSEVSNGVDAANTETVLNWLDNTANTNNAIQATEGNKPVFTEPIINYNPALDFDGNKEMTTSIITNGNELLTIFAVFDGDTSSSKTLFRIEDDDTNEFISVEQTVSGTIQGRYNNGADSGVVNGSITPGEPSIIQYWHRPNDGANTLYINGATIDTDNASGSFNFNGPATVDIGAEVGSSSTRWNGNIAELIVYNGTLSDANRRWVGSYLALKYGITLGANDSSQNYKDSDNRIIFEGADDSDYDWNIAGIGRDDKSGLNQKQSKTVYTDDDITVGIKEISATNNTNPTNYFSNKTFLIWGHDKGALTPGTDITNDFGAGNVSATPIERKWKMVVTDSVPTVKLSIPKSMVSSTNPGDADDYIMIVADDDAFSINVTSVTMDIVNVSGTDYLQVDHYFEDTKYITFGSAAEVDMGDRAVYFNNSATIDTYLDAGDVNDLNGMSFTISAWVKRNNDDNKFDIVSKRNYFDETIGPPENFGGFSYGYAFRINQNSNLRLVWKNHGDDTTNQLETVEEIPFDEWHHVAATYDYINNYAALYIDGFFVYDSDDFEADKGYPIEPLVNGTDAHFMIGAAHHIRRQQKVRGSIDEVRVWNVALTGDQIRYIMNQEIEEDGSNMAAGKILPANTTKNEIITVPWNNLIAYYPMSTQVFGSIKDESNSGNDASMINAENSGSTSNYNGLEAQTAPLPYKTTQDGAWDAESTWENGNVQYLPGIVSYLYENYDYDNDMDIDDFDKQTIDYNIVQIDHNITMDNVSDSDKIPTYKNGVRSLLGLTVSTGAELQLDGDTSTHTGNAVNISHYLKIEGVIDLEGESQLIQTTGSYLDPSSTGRLERDQQGIKDLYTYNYWSSPVRPDLTPGNLTYKIPDVLNDGTTIKTTPSEVPDTIGFLTSGYDGATSPTFSIADYWIWKFDNRPTDDYGSWQHVRSTEDMIIGEGYTMKGVEDTGGSVTQFQNYVFSGKPNNGDITLDIDPGNDYLIGNPYPSAIDADEFLRDNISSTDTPTGRNSDNIINGTLYFWDHFAPSSHYLAEYEGGYATYTLMGSAVAISNDSRINATHVSGTKTPGQFIPVGQGFFVSATLDIDLNNDGEDIDGNPGPDPDPNDPLIAEAITGGTIQFLNSQRVFQKEDGSTSVFLKNSITKKETALKTDPRQKIRFMFDSPQGYHRQLMVGIDEHATDGIDVGYDGVLIENNKEDLFWNISNAKFIIQAVNNFDVTQTLDLELKTKQAGLSTIKIDELVNISNKLDIFLHDKELGIYQDLNKNEYEVYLEPDHYSNRFEITFSNNQALEVDDIEQSKVHAYFSNEKESIILHNPNSKNIKSVEVYNILGQSVFTINKLPIKNYTEHKAQNLQSGAYILKVITAEGAFTKKVLIN